MADRLGVMPPSSRSCERPALGSHLAAMVTPMRPDGAISWSDVDRLVDHLVEGGCDGVVVAGTTGEAPTLSTPETMRLVERVALRAQGAACVVAGVGTNDTTADVIAARQVASAGADALLVATPYYSRPSQSGVIAHVTAIGDAVALPIMLYDIPVRTGVAFTSESLLALAEHPRIVAVKDAKGDLAEAMDVMARTSLAYYCGTDELNLPYLACGARGLVSVVANLRPQLTRGLLTAVDAGDLGAARRIAREIDPVARTLLQPGPAASSTKVALVEAGVIGSRAVRLPLVAGQPPVIDDHARAG